MPDQYRIANPVLFALVLAYLVMLGGGSYEHINVAPVVTQAPPMSTAMLHGPYAFSPVKFWATFRPVTFILFLAAIILHWRLSRRRNLLLLAFALDMFITIATFTYFAPETAVISRYSETAAAIDSDQLARALLWKNLNTIRLLAMYAASITLLLALNSPLPARNSAGTQPA
jgi:hypothetical protein